MIKFILYVLCAICTFHFLDAHSQSISPSSPEAASATVTVSAIRDPVDKSYRQMIRGMDIFEKNRELAPNSTLSFRLLPRQEGVEMHSVSLKVVGESFSSVIPSLKNNRFVLERNQKAWDEDASVRPNRKVGSLTWRAEVRTVDLPENVLRLGDLRLSCLVGKEAGLISEGTFMGKLLFNSRDFCNDQISSYLFFSERPLFHVSLEAGSRKMDIPIERLYAGKSTIFFDEETLKTCDCQVLLDKTYFLPLGDLSWPNDTVIRIEYMDDVAIEKVTLPSPEAKQVSPKEKQLGNI